MVFVIHWHESALDIHVFSIPIPPPTSLSTRSLWVFPVHQVQALVSCIQPGLVICFTLDNIHVSMLFSRNIPPSPSPTQRKCFARVRYYLIGFPWKRFFFSSILWQTFDQFGGEKQFCQTASELGRRVLALLITSDAETESCSIENPLFHFRQVKRASCFLPFSSNFGQQAATIWGLKCLTETLQTQHGLFIAMMWNRSEEGPCVFFIFGLHFLSF